MKIYITIVNQYGNQRIFPACPTANKFAELIRQKTFDEKHLAIIKELGFEIEVKQPELPKF